MKTPMLTTHPRNRYLDAQPLRFRAELPTLRTPAGAFTSSATHDFLVPNPRPDLTGEADGVRMTQSPRGA